MRKVRVPECLVAVGLAATFVVSAPLAASAVVTMPLAGRSCPTAPAPYVHITSEAKGKLRHYHHLTGAPSATYVSFTNTSWTTRISSLNYRQETSPYITVEDGGSITSGNTSCDV